MALFLYLAEKFIMAALDKLVYNLKNLPGTHTDDFPTSNRQIEFIINHFRAELSTQRANSKQSLDGFYQELIDLKLTKTNDYRAFKSGVTILKSKVAIPTLTSSNRRGGVVDFVGFRDDFLGFQKTTLHTFNIDLENPMVTELYFVVDNNLYIVSQSRYLAKEVLVRAVFSDPRAVKIYNNELTSVAGMDWEYPLPMNLVGQMNNMIINGEWKWKQVLKADAINDGKDAE